MSNSADTGAPTAAAIAAAGITYPPIDELLTRTSSCLLYTSDAADEL